MDNHILVVEDDAAIREGVRILLEGEGYIVQEAEDGYQCLKKVVNCNTKAENNCDFTYCTKM